MASDRFFFIYMPDYSVGNNHWVHLMREEIIMSKWNRLLHLVAVCLAMSICGSAAATAGSAIDSYDVVIRYGHIIDGTGSPWYPGDAVPYLHPSAYGIFSRIFRKDVREDHFLTLPDAIRKMTALPAQRMGFTERGVLKQGIRADVVVFDPGKIRDLATFEHPNQRAVGMKYVLVNGVPAIDDGKMTGALAGVVLVGSGRETCLHYTSNLGKSP